MTKQSNPKDLKKLAEDICEGRVFTQDHVKSPEDLPMVFLPLILGALKGKKEDVAFIYEYISERMPRSINGYPIFGSFHCLSKEELKELNIYYQEYRKFKEQWNNKT